MPGVTREQIERAKAVNIEDYILSHEPYNIKRVGHTLYLKDHDSLRISNGLWKWESRDIGGRNVVDYLIKVRGYEFTDAVRHLAGDEIAPVRTVAPKARPPTMEHPTAERESLRLPRRNENNTRVIEYLQSRGIDEKLIHECIRQNILYESADFHNAVFVGRDENGKARFAAMRGTIGTFKRDADGSDKSYGFCLSPNNRDCKTVIVFESPIDAISHKTLCPEVDGYRLSLGGTALAALTRFLETHKETQSIIICTDNDAAGNFVAQKIAELTGYNVTRKLPPDGAKDWNDALISNRNEVNLMEDKRKAYALSQAIIKRCSPSRTAIVSNSQTVTTAALGISNADISTKHILRSSVNTTTITTSVSLPKLWSAMEVNVRKSPVRSRC